MNRVLLVEDHAVLRESMAVVFEREGDIEVVGQAGTAGEARTMLTGWNVAVVDLGLPDGNGFDLIRELRAANPKGHVLVLTGSTKRGYFSRAVDAGAAGVLNKSASFEEVADAVRRLYEGNLLMSAAEVVEMLRLASQQRERDQQAQAAIKELTPREHEVLELLSQGLSDRQIAERLVINEVTARAHVSKIIQKFKVESRLQAVLFAVRHGAVEIEEPE